MSGEHQEATDPFTPEQRSYINEFLAKEVEYRETVSARTHSLQEWLWFNSVLFLALRKLLISKEVFTAEEFKDACDHQRATLAIEEATNPEFAEIWRIRERLEEIERERRRLAGEEG